MRLQVRHIIAACAVQAGVSVDELLGPDRHHPICHPRQRGMYLVRKLLRRSYPDIGRRFGDRDHTTVIHACRTVELRLEATQRDQTFDERDALEAIKARFVPFQKQALLASTEEALVRAHAEVKRLEDVRLALLVEFAVAAE